MHYKEWWLWNPCRTSWIKPSPLQPLPLCGRNNLYLRNLSFSCQDEWFPFEASMQEISLCLYGRHRVPYLLEVLVCEWEGGTCIPYSAFTPIHSAKSTHYYSFYVWACIILRHKHCCIPARLNANSGCWISTRPWVQSLGKAVTDRGPNNKCQRFFWGEG